MRDVWPRGHCHPLCLLDRPVLISAPTSVSGIPGWSWRGFLVSFGSGQGVFHGLALLLGQLLIKVPVGEKASLKDRDGSGDAAFGNDHPLLIEAGYVASHGFCPMLEDFV
ncbi:hypothetical protein F2Q69_00012966 [Brassica cretica]|uniref:Uncharacterized protein n=1 Tax=Brassica cretica TaxID=69181 RepID=A0A8S9R9N8_BRACR|nr:hypothetical protein F2Q69_00012966 [Brassica cretica]